MIYKSSDSQQEGEQYSKTQHIKSSLSLHKSTTENLFQTKDVDPTKTLETKQENGILFRRASFFFPKKLKEQKLK